MAKAAAPTFKEFLQRFPAATLPVTLGEDTHHTYSSTNKPLSEEMVHQFIWPLEQTDVLDDVTEFIACFSLEATKEYIAIVYWKAELLNYQYRLATFDKKGSLIDQKVIAGTAYIGDEVTQSAAVINEDRQVYMVSGQGQMDARNYSAATSTANRLQIGTNGKIVEL